MSGALMFEDFPVGATWTLGGATVTEDAIVDFAVQYDPQPFHVDAEAAAAGPFGGLVASGWHTMVLTSRILVEELYSSAHALGSPGVEAITWPHPVRPGDRLTVTFTVTEARRSRSRPDRGVVQCRVETINQNREVVLALNGVNFFAVREHPET